MTKLLTGLAVGAAMLVGVGAAQAEPVKLTGPQMDSVTAAGWLHRIKFSLANAEADAYADGKVSVADTYTYTYTAPYYASAYSASTSCSGTFCLN